MPVIKLVLAFYFVSMVQESKTHGCVRTLHQRYLIMKLTSLRQKFQSVQRVSQFFLLVTALNEFCKTKTSAVKFPDWILIAIIMHMCSAQLKRESCSHSNMVLIL